MKKIKKAMALSLALAMGLSLVACGDKKDDGTTTEAPASSETPDSEAPADSEETEGGEEAASGVDAWVEGALANGSKINVYSWNDELGNRIDTHFRSRYPEVESLVVYNNLNIEGTTDEYPAKIKAAYDEGGDGTPGIVAADDSVALSFMEKDWAIPVTDLGLTLDMYSNAYQFTVDYATNANGDLMAMTWQAAGGVFAYNTEIAEEVLGTSDPDEVQSMISNWDGFLDVAAKMKEKGYAMVSGADEVKYPMLDQRKSAWVIDGKLNVDPAVEEFFELSKTLYTEGYTMNAAQWSTDWTANMTNKTTFGYFGCTWFIPWSLTIEDTDAFGKYRVVSGPVGYHWGGSYLTVTDKCENKDLAALVIYTLCCDEEAMYDLFAKDTDYPNNQAAVKKLMDDGVGALDKLGGQNPLEAYDATAKKVEIKIATSYDSQINNIMSDVSGKYNSGEIASVEAAVADLKAQVSATITDITVE
ncbi:MAG: extracellular solute-binding protein [Clostridium sp.]|nr:extracellular solute-binding protein [Clostridium sp.]MCM1400131.1 extracellular solute-binding protein [Clostridium sp.]MCM1460818.1 extracellular solute-binding protein [Bacteroides sp.]